MQDEDITLDVEIIADSLKEDLTNLKLHCKETKRALKEVNFTTILKTNTLELLDLQEFDYFHDKLAIKVQGIGKSFYAYCRDNFTEIGGMGVVPTIQSWSDLNDIFFAMKKQAVVAQPINVKPGPIGYVTPGSNLILAYYEEGFDHEAIKDTNMFYLSFVEKDGIELPMIYGAAATSEHDAICISKRNGIHAEEDELEIGQQTFEYLIRNLDALSDFISRMEAREQQAPKISEPETILKATMKTPLGVAYILKDLESMSRPNYFYDITNGEMDRVKNLNNKIERFLSKYDKTDKLPMQLSKNQTDFVSALVGCRLRPSVHFSIKAKNAISSSLYGEMTLVPYSKSEAPIKVYKISPLIFAEDKIVTPKALVQLNEKSFTIPTLPDRIGDIWKKPRRNLDEMCAEFILKNDALAYCSNKSVVSPFVTLENCNYPTNLILSSPNKRQILLQCPEKAESTHLVDDGNTIFPKSDLCTITDKLTKHILFQPNFDQNTQMVPQAQFMQDESFDLEEDVVPFLLDVLRRDNQHFLYMVIIVLVGIIGLCLILCSCYCTCLFTRKKQCGCFPIAPCIEVGKEEDDEHELEFFRPNGNNPHATVSRVWATSKPSRACHSSSRARHMY